MPSTESQSLRPGAGQNEVELFVAKTRDELNTTMDHLRQRFDVKTRAQRALESFRRDYEKSPATFNATGIAIAAIGGIVALIALVKRGRNG
jgi:hypothetical protein